MVFNHFYTSEVFSSFVGGVFGAKILSNLTISSVCLYYLSEAGRFFGKHLFENSYFREEAAMPTTTLLLFRDNAYSAAYKHKIREKVLKDFGINLPTEPEEAADEGLARTRIVEVMALIRKKLHQNPFLLQHNIEYGAIRNAIGGAVLGALFSIVNIIFFYAAVRVPIAVLVSAVTLSVYLLLIIFSKVLLEFYGRN